MPDTPGLLVSVRSADEVDDALGGGRDRERGGDGGGERGATHEVSLWGSGGRVRVLSCARGGTGAIGKL